MQYPTLASVPHSIAKAYRNLAAIGVQTAYEFGPVADLKKRIANPGAYAIAAPGGNGGKAAAAPAAAAAPVVEEKAASSEGEMELDLFG